MGESDHHRNVLDCTNALLCILILQLQAPRAPNNGSGIGQLLRDPDHYEEINVIGNGETNEEDYGDCFGYFKHIEYSAMTDVVVIFSVFILAYLCLYISTPVYLAFAQNSIICSFVMACHLMTYDRRM